MSLEAGADKAAGGRLGGIQLLRAAAAMLVVVGHSQTAAADLARSVGGHISGRPLSAPWGGGVDLFFVISGFIMVYASRQLFGREGAGGEFLRRRLVRVVPLYWLCTLAYVALVAVTHARGAALSFSAPAVLASLVFIPYPSFGAAAGLFPVLDLGWTLNYEMFFYAVFAGFVFWRRRWAVPLVLAGLTGLVLAGPGLASLAGPLRFWTQPIVLEFGLGVVVGAVRCEGVRLPAAVWAPVLALGVAAFLLDPLHLFSGPQGSTVANGWPRVLTEGLPAAAVLAALVLGTDRLPRALAPATILGDASYSLYLTHPFTLIALDKLLVRTGLAHHLDLWAFAALATAVSIGVSLMSYRFVETPLTRAAQRLAQKSTPRPTPVPILAVAASEPSP